MHQLYEVQRVSAHCEIPMTDFSSCLSQSLEAYDSLWHCLTKTVKESNGHPLPEKSSSAAWRKAGEHFEGVALACKLTFCDQSNGPLFKVSWSPLRLEPSYRLARQFGHDRFCTVGFPSLDPQSLPQHLRLNAPTAREAIIDWLVKNDHHFLGRVWRVFFVKPEPTKKNKMRTKSLANDVRFRLYLFATDGVASGLPLPIGEVDTHRPSYKPVSVRDLIEWFMPFEVNRKEPCLKFFNRLGLGQYFGSYPSTCSGLM